VMRLTAATALLVASIARPAVAQTLDACTADATRALVAAGARVRSVERAFLLERDSAVFEVALEEDGCTGLLAFGGASLRDVDLLVGGLGGEVIEEDVEPRSWGWARACGAAGDRVAVIAHAFAGRGEVRVIVASSAPEAAPDPGRAIGACFARSGGVRRPIGDPGAPAPMRSIDEAVASSDRAAEPLGWRAVGEARRGWLEPGASDPQRLSLRGGTCYRVDALAGPELRDLSLTLLDPRGEVAAEDRARVRDASVAICAEHDGGWVAQARASSGAGAYALRLRALEGEPLPEARADPRASIESVELASRLRARGMRARAIAWGLADRVGEQAFDVRVPAGCAALSALRSIDLGEGDLDVRVEDARGRLVAWDVGPASVARGPLPIAWSCAREARTLRVVVQAREGRGRFLLVAGQDDAPARAAEEGAPVTAAESGSP
jgi:hypothetical protein